MITIADRRRVAGLLLTADIEGDKEVPMPEYIVLLNAKDPEYTEILTNESGGNMVFSSADEADSWIEDHARNGWSTLIVELD